MSGLPLSFCDMLISNLSFATTGNIQSLSMCFNETCSTMLTYTESSAADKIHSLGIRGRHIVNSECIPYHEPERKANISSS